MSKFLSSQVRLKPDYVFFSLAMVLVGVGLLLLSSASSVVGYQHFHDSYYYFKHQLLFGFLPGLALLLFFSHFDYRRLKAFALPALIVSVVLLVLVFVPKIGVGYGGAKRWLSLAGFVFQPSEFIKLTVLMYFAAWFENRMNVMRDWQKGFIPFVIAAGLVIGLVVLQPDLGTASVFAVSLFFTYLIAGASASQVFALLLGGGALGLLVIKLFPHSAQRLTVFFNPALDSQGVSYHINQALLAVGSGGLFGLGLGYSRQKYLYLPEVTGDSIFAVIAEELGFILSLVFLALVAALLWRGIRIAQRAPDAFGRYLVCGIMVWLGWQTCLNIASMLSLLPLTGVPLPFVSYGGTALATAMAAIGIVLNVSRYERHGAV